MSSTFASSELLRRVVVGAGLVALALGELWLGGFWFWMFVTAIGLMMLSELAPLLSATPVQRRFMLYALCVPLGIIAPIAAGLNFYAVGALIGVALATYAVTRRASLAGAFFYVGVPIFCLLWLRERPDGLMLALWSLMIVWATDIGAYFAGRAIGGPKIAPSISPSKTWAGLGGGVVAAMLVGWVFNRVAGLPAELAMVSGILAVAAQVGDFYESWLKRRAGVKDSGTLLPGHGGVLDRLDGVVTAVPLATLLVWAGAAA